jgi:phosphoesterase RecJ-like protein
MAPDGDAIGSMLGMKWLLESLGKEVTAGCQDGVPAPLRFLPGWKSVVTQAPDISVDLLVCLDSSDRERLGQLYRRALHAKTPMLNIDHHVTNLHYGTLNLVDDQASSTAQVVYNIAQALNWSLDREAAQCLLTGVVTDTRGFRTSNVTADTLGVAKGLMDAGASLTLITDNVLERRTLNSICLWGRALSEFQHQDRILWTVIPLTMREACHGTDRSDTGLVNFLLAAEEIDMAVVFSERPDGTVDVGMRAVPGFDVAQVALDLGGGGHPQAAGCNLNLSLVEAQDLVLAALKATRQATQPNR